MSKAFKPNEDSEGEDEAGAPSGGAPLPKGTKNYMTPGGADRMRSELQSLLHTERPKVVETVSWAASNGDRSENGDYIYGKRRLREIDRRIRFLTKRLEAAVVVDPATQKSDKVLFGATVTVTDEDGEEHTYQIVGIDETEPSRGRISWISPIGKSLLQARVGDEISIRTPKGVQELEVMKIQYIPIS